MNIPKKHHYVSSFYLAGFTNNSLKNGTFFCYDLKLRKSRPSKPCNEAYEHNFNKMNLPNINPYELEFKFSQIEDKVSVIIKDIIAKEYLPNDNELRELLYYMALISSRNPYNRKLYSSLKEKKGQGLNNKILLDEPKEVLLYWEFVLTDHLYSNFIERKWSIFVINHNSKNHFITSNAPVELLWSNPTKYNNSPSFYDKDSIIYFPINKSIVLVGSFNHSSLIKKDISDNEIAIINWTQLFYKNKNYVYSPTSEFIFFNGTNIVSSSTLLK